MTEAVMRALQEGRNVEAAMTPDWIRKMVESADFDAPGFSYKKLREATYREAIKREANPSGAFGQLLRADTQRVADQWYNEVQGNYTYAKVCQSVNSNKRQEFYDPLMTAAVATFTAEGQPYQESGVVGLDIEVKARKWMGGESFTRELFDDDLTGQIRARQRRLAEAQARTLEIYFAQRMTGLSGTFGPLTIPVSSWSTFPTAVNQFDVAVGAVYTPTGATGLGNRLSTFLPLSTSGLKEAQELLEVIPDRQGNRLGKVPNTLLISPKDRFHASIILNSAFYPTVIGAEGQTWNTADSARAGAPGASNPWKGLYELLVNRYLADWSWYLGIAGEGIVFQLRDPFEVVQEVPFSGASFENDVIRFRSRSRWEVEWIDPRSWIQGDDGTVAGAF